MPPGRRGGGFRARGGAKYAPSARGGRGGRGGGGGGRGGHTARTVIAKSRVADLDFPEEDDQDNALLEPQRQIEDDFTEEEIEDSSSEGESEPETPGLSYNALLEGFGEKEEHEKSRRKRRKLNGHREAGDTITTNREHAPNGKSYNTLMKAFQKPSQNGSALSPEIKSPELESVEGPSDGDNDGSASEADRTDGSSVQGSEAEYGEEEALDDQEEALDDEDEEVSDDKDVLDPFEFHLNPGDEQHTEARIKDASTGKWLLTRSDFGTLGQCTSSRSNNQPQSNKKRIPQTTEEIPSIKRKLLRTAPSVVGTLDAAQQALAPSMFNYEDVLFGARSIANASSLRNLACLHALNHIYKTRDRVLKNNERLASDADLEARDQGFTRPKVLFLLETRQNCAKYAESIIELSGAEQVENKKRLFDAFSSTDQHPDDMPEDFRELFDGNDDNVFRVGLKFTRKTLKFFSQFYASDIIFASPLGLRLAVEGKGPKHQDSDFLSSIELVVVDQAEAMLMQNWEHVEYVFEHLNLQPKESHGCDYSRVRNWYLDANARYLRQTIVLSAFLTPTLLGLYSKHMRNIEGKLKYQPTFTGAIADPSIRILGIQQTFSRLHAISPSADPDARFQYLTTSVLPSLARLPKPSNGGQGVLIFVPLHADFSRLQNYFATSSEALNISFGAISEFTEPSAVRRARSHFERGRHSMLLYSARAHHFRRYRIKGVRKIVFYGLPDNPVFYEEIVRGFLGQSAAEGKLAPDETAVRAMFSKWDLLALERVVGSSRVNAMVREGSGGDTFDFA